MATQATAQRGFSFLRIAITLQTLTIFVQAVSAGLLLTSSYGQTLHSAGARVMYGASLLYVLAAVLAWKPGGGSPGPSGTRPASSSSPPSRSCSASRTCRRSISPWAS
ncbi:hypothetical protein GCM10027612_35630 [Microbispora bryophytorum subsp. camponoti]